MFSLCNPQQILESAESATKLIIPLPRNVIQITRRATVLRSAHNNQGHVSTEIAFDNASRYGADWLGHQRYVGTQGRLKLDPRHQILLHKS